jgi:adenosine/AMP kinase
MDITTVPLRVPAGINLILGQSHFIKTVEDLHEAVVGAVPQVHFGLAFNEASGPALVRWSGNDEELQGAAREAMLELGAGHAFLILLRDAFPINILPAVRAVQEVCAIFCATANPVEVVIAETDQGRGVLGVVDGVRAKGIETAADVAERQSLLRRFGYKLG